MAHQYPVLLVVESLYARLLKRLFDPAEVMVVPPLTALQGHRFRAVIVVKPPFSSPVRQASLQDWIDHLGCRLAVDCTDNFFVLGG